MNPKISLYKVLDLLYDGVILTDKAGKVLYMNHQTLKIFRIEQEYLGVHITKLIPNCRIPIVMETNIADVNVYQAIRENTIIVYCNYPLYDSNKTVIGGLAVFKEVSETGIQLEDTQTLKALKEKLIVLKSVLNFTQDAVSIVDENGIMVMVNHAYKALTERTEEEVLGKNCRQNVRDEDNIHLKVLSSKVTITDMRVHLPWNGKNVLVSGSPVIVDNELKGSVAVTRDLTETEELERSILSLYKALRIKRNIYNFSDIIGKSPKMKAAISEAKRIAKLHATVMLYAEKGCEIEKMASAIHYDCFGPEKPFVAVNCACFTEKEMELAIFGSDRYPIEKVKESGGLLEQADGGTLFVENIHQMGLGVQMRFLQVLQEKRMVRGSKDIFLHLRVIVSSCVDMDEEVKKGSFLEALYYRLNIITITIPPLRERAGDIPEIINEMLAEINFKCSKNIKGITEEACFILIEKYWEYNLDELYHFIENVVRHIKDEHRMITYQDIVASEEIEPKKENMKENEYLETLDEYVSRMEKSYILKMLSMNNDNKARTARELGVSIRNFYYKLKKYGIDD